MNAAWVLSVCAAAAGLRAVLGRFALSYRRGRGFFEQCIIRGCWVFLGLLFLLTLLTRPESLPANLIATDLTIIAFLLGCALALEGITLAVFRSRIINGQLVCKTDRFGTVRFSAEKLDLIFAMRTGPQGLSDQTWLVPIHRGIPSPIPRFVVYQVLVRTRETYPFKYLLVGEARRRVDAEALVRNISSELNIATLPERVEERSRLRAVESETA